MLFYEGDSSDLAFKRTPLPGEGTVDGMLADLVSLNSSFLAPILAFFLFTTLSFIWTPWIIKMVSMSSRKSWLLSALAQWAHKPLPNWPLAVTHLERGVSLAVNPIFMKFCSALMENCMRLRLVPWFDKINVTLSIRNYANTTILRESTFKSAILQPAIDTLDGQHILRSPIQFS